MQSEPRLSAAKPLRHRWIRAILGHHRLVLVAALIATIVAGWLASQLQIDSDLRRLLPADHPVVSSLERLERTFHGTGSVNVVVKGADAETRHRFADALAERFEDHEMVAEVDYRLPSEFFVEHALYYLDDGEMEQLEERVDAWTHYELCTAEPDVCTLEPDPKAPKRLRTFVEAKQEEAWKRTGFRDYYEREGIEALVVLLHPTKPSSDLEFAAAITAEARRVVAEEHGKGGPFAALEYNLVGPYVVKADEQETIARDMIRSGAVGLLGVMVILYVMFRSFRAVLTLLVPLVCGVTWSLGATQLLLGHLTSMTSLISTVVMGVGIDAGIHFFSRARKERQQYDSAASIRRAFHGLVIPLLIASSTTVGAFLVMASSNFPAFHEFGVIAAMGVALCLLAMVTVLPALAVLVGIKHRPARADGGRGRWAAERLLARPGTVFAVLVAATVLSFQAIRHVEFEYDGRKLQSDQARANTEADTNLISSIFGKDIHAGVIVIPTLEEVQNTLDQARSRREARMQTTDSVVADLFAAPDLLPPAALDLQVRADAIAELGDLIPDTAWERLDARAKDEEKAGTGAGTAGDKPTSAGEGAEGGGAEGMSPEDAAMLRKMLAAKPFGVDQLPKVVLNKVRAEDGTYGLFAYPAFDAANIQEGVRFMEETDGYLSTDAYGIFVGETTVYAAMYQVMRAEAPIILGMAAVLIAALVFWQLRSVPHTLMTLLPLGLGLWWLGALMGVTGLRFTLFNLPILPAVLGIGVDNGVYLTDRIRRIRKKRDGLVSALEETGGAIMAATATTVVGFASFLVADSGGLRGIGWLAVFGILIAAAASILVLPTLSAIARRRSG